MTPASPRRDRRRHDVGRDLVVDHPGDRDGGDAATREQVDAYDGPCHERLLGERLDPRLGAEHTYVAVVTGLDDEAKSLGLKM